MSDVILGTTSATEQPIRYGFDPVRGPFTQRSWKGIRTAVENICPSLTLLGYKWEVSQLPGGIWEVTATIAADITGAIANGGVAAEVVDDWELVPNVVQKDLLESDCAAVRALTTAQISQIRYSIENPPESASPAWTDVTHQEPIYKLMQAGVKSHTVFQPIMRHIWLVPKNVDPGFTFFNVGRIITLNTMRGTEGLPNTFLIPIQQITGAYTTRTDGVSLVNGWLKSMPTMQQSANGRRIVTMEYQYGAWPSLLAGTAI